MKNIVISGAGPIGLYTAIRLSKIISNYNLNTKITVIDSRVGNYNRPGVVAKNVIPLMEKEIGRITVADSGDNNNNSMFIQDLEKSLYKIAKALPITFISSDFHGFKPGKILVNNNKSIHELDCDLAIDCTGQRRALVKKINEIKHKAPPFQIKRIGNNPIKEHFVAYVTMDLENANLIESKKNKNFLKYSLTMEELRAKFNWPEFSQPTLQSGKWEKEDSACFYFYFEMPPHQDEETDLFAQEWLSTLLKLYYEAENIKFETESGLKFTRFIVDPHYIENLAYTDNSLPMIIPCGDAQMGPDYRLGMGIKSGVERTNALCAACISIKNHLSINLDAYANDIMKPIAKHKTALEKEYSEKRYSLQATTLDSAEEKYTKALETGTKEEKEIIENALKKIKPFNKAMKTYREAKVEFKDILNKKGEIAYKITKKNMGTLSVESPEKLEQYRKSIDEALKNSLTLSANEILKSAALDLAAKYKNLAKIFYCSGIKEKLGKAAIYYKESLNIYLNHFNKSHGNEIVTLYSNLSIIANKRGDFSEAIKNSSLALQVIDEENLVDLKTLKIKIKFNLCKALVEKLSSRKEKEIKSSHSLQLSEIKDIFSKLDGVSPQDLNKLKQKIERIEKELNIADKSAGDHSPSYSL